MKTRTLSVILLFADFLCISCKHSALIKESSYTNYLDDSIFVKAEKIDAVLYGETLKENTYLNNDAYHNRIICFNAKGKVFDTICYPAQSKCKGIFAFSLDSFAILFPRSLLLYNRKTHSQREFILCDTTFKCESDDEPLLVQDSLVFFFKYPMLPPYLNTQENWDLYSDTACYQAEYNLKKGRFEYIKDPSFPKHIYEGNSYYSWGNHCINTKKHEIITSYEHSPAIVIYNYFKDTCHDAVIHDPGFIPNEKFDESRIFDYSYLAQYCIENTRFGRIAYNPFRNEYYHTLYKKINYNNEDSTTNSAQDRPFSIEILDSNFSIKQKIAFPGKKYWAVIIPVQDGFLLLKITNVHSQYEEAAYGKFKL